jgi:hypothetical protein
VGKPEENRPPVRPRYRGNNIKMNFKEIGWEDEEWIRLMIGICGGVL